MKHLPILFFFIGINLASGQIVNPVHWNTSWKQVSDDEFDLIFTANIDKGWHIYSQYLEGEDGPIPTSFNFNDSTAFELIGKNVESDMNRKEAFDDLFDMNVVTYEKKAVFTQRVKGENLSKPITGYLEFMTCDNTRCLPPEEVDFEFPVKSSSKKSSPKAKTPAVEKTTSSVVLKEPDVQAKGASNGILKPVKWSLKAEKTDEQTYDLVFKAVMDKGWYIYSQYLEGEDGPDATSFNFDENDHLKTEGKAREESAHRFEGLDEIFDMNVIKFKNEVTFTQPVQVSDVSQTIKGYIEFMTCNDRQCLPPAEVPFKVNLATLNALIGDAAEENEITGSLSNEASTGSSTFVIDTQPVSECGLIATKEKTKGLWGIFILGLLGGLVALLTPCVFPMIPLTVSFFTKGSQNKRKGLGNAFLYGLFIFLVYLALSLPFHLMDSLNPDILNDVSTNIWLNIGFFLVFLIFALSFFGYYELTLPASWSNKVSSAEGIGGTIGIFFMALTLALVSFSCTGPILGSLLAGAMTANGGAMQLTSGMAGFGLALALPFGLFAAFPGWLNSLPKSGSWLNTVKVVLGFLELALALKFLSNADLVKEWGLLKIEPFLALWIVIFTGMGLYLFGKIKFPHDSPLKKLSIGRIGLGLASFAFVVYLASGFIFDERANSFRPLKLLSGLAPPSCYSWIHPCDCPQNLSCFKDFEEGLAYAKEANKPIMIDFTGHACVNCRKMEEHVWPEGAVYKHLKDNYVLISLYVDEKIDLPAEEQITVPKKSGGSRKLRTVGNKWAYFQTENFNNNSQPYYVLLSPDGKLLNKPVGYTPDAQQYADFLQCGLDAFDKLSEEKVLGAK